MAQLLHLGLTGGIGCGKSTVAGMLIELGATLIDADAISKQLTAPGGLALPAIARQFGPEFITSEGLWTASVCGHWLTRTAWRVPS